MSPQHLQALDRFHEVLVAARVGAITPYDWGVVAIDFDVAALGTGQVRLQRFAGVMPDGGLFDFPGECPPPAPITTPETVAGQLIWLTMPARADNFREVSAEQAENAARYVVGAETVIDSTANLRIEEEIEVAYPRLCNRLGRWLDPHKRGRHVRHGRKRAAVHIEEDAWPRAPLRKHGEPPVLFRARLCREALRYFALEHKRER